MKTTEMLAGLVLLTLLIALIWFSDDEHICDVADEKITALAMCLENNKCFTTPSDFESGNFWVDVSQEYCKEDD